MPITQGQPQAPKARTSKTPAPAPAPSQQTILKGRAEAVYGLFQITSGICLATKNFADAAAITEHGENVALECARVAESNEQFANVIDKLTQVGPYAGLMTAMMPLVMQIAVNHKRMEAGAMGTVAPEVLDAQVKAQMAEKKAKFLREAREATERANKAEAEFHAEVAA